MARVTISLLGSLEIKLDAQPVTHLITGKGRALLAYLAIEAARPHRRETLAGLLWPDYEDRSARANLRNALSSLRRAIPGDQMDEPFLLVTRETIQFNAESDCWVDVAAFNTLIEANSTDTAAVSALESAAALYRGPFLEDFAVGDSSVFHDWTLIMRERLEQQALQALQSLTAYYERQGEAARAREYVRRQIALAPWRENAHQALMRLLALSGQRGAALAQYEACCRALRAELDVEPGEETRRLYERIRDGELAPPKKENTGGIRVSRETRAPATIPRTRQAVLAPSEHPPSRSQPAPLRSGVPTRSPPEEGKKLTGERRLITAMFADVKGCTALAEQIDTEDWVEIMRHTLQILSAEIHRYGGKVDRYEGDGLVAFFGLATAHEDDAERAVLSALAMQEAVKRYAQELAARQGTELLLRVGIATGEVIATHVGEARQHGEATAMGRTLALAARLEPAAEPGTILVNENTYRLLQRSFEWQAMGGIPAKRYSEPVAAYRPLKHRAMSGKGRGIEGLSSPLVGRDKELHALKEAIHRLQVGIGGIVTVVGEAGIGKSRLVAEARKWANAESDASQDVGSHPEQPTLAVQRSPQWDEGRCLSYGSSTAYLLWLNMLRGMLHVAPDALPTVVSDALWTRVQALCPDCFDAVYPYLCRLMSLPLDDEHEAIRDMQGESLRAGMFRAVQTLIASAAVQQPLVMVCEDLHWADVASLALLDRVLALTDRCALLLICVFRPEVEHPCWQLKETAARLYRHRHTDLWLDALSADESRTLVGHLLRVEALPAELRGKILDRAEGNPFYVEEIIRTLIDAAADGGAGIVCDDAAGQWRATHHVADLPIPDTLHGVLMARIDRLEPEAKRVLQLASVIGRIFTYPILSGIHPSLSPEGEGKAPDTLFDHLVALERAQLIRERARVPELEYIFKHELTREAAYNGLLKRERRAYHQQVAEALERLFPEQANEQAELLAHHWEQAGKAEKAIHYLHRAGDKAAQLSAYQESRAHLTKALSLLDTLPNSSERAEQELALQLSLGIACWATYDTYPEAAKAYTRARELCQQVGTTIQLCLILGALATLRFVGAEYKSAHALGQEALKLAQQTKDPVLLAASHWRLGSILFALGEYRAAHAHLKQTIAFYEPHHHQALVSLCVANPGPSAIAYDACCLWCLGYPDQALRRSREALTLARELDHPFTLGDVLTLAGCQLHVMRRDAQALKESAEELLRLPGGMDLIWWTQGALHQGEAVAMMGQIQEGIAQMHEGIAAFHAIGSRALVPGTLGSLAVAQAKAGQPQEGLTTLAEALDLVAETEEHHWEAELYRLRGELLLIQDDEDEAETSLQAERCFQQAIEVARRQHAKSWELRATTSLARLWRTQGRVDEARQMLAAIYDWFSEGFDSADLMEARTLLEELSS